MLHESPKTHLALAGCPGIDKTRAQPHALSAGSFWLWGPPDKPGEIAISIGNEADAVHHFYEEVALIKMIRHPYAIDEEHNIPFYLCRKPKITLQDYWTDWRERIFE